MRVGIRLHHAQICLAHKTA